MNREYRKPKIERVEFDDVITTSATDWQDTIDIIGPPNYADWSNEY